MILDDLTDLAATSYLATAASGADMRRAGPPRSRHQIADVLLEELATPFDPQQAYEYQRDRWAEKNVAAMAAAHGDDEDPNKVYGPS